MRRLPSWAATGAAALALLAATLSAPAPALADAPAQRAPLTAAASAPANAPTSTNAPTSANPTPAAFSTAPATAALKRLLPRHADQFALKALPRTSSGDQFTIGGRAGRVEIGGTSPAVLLSGVNWYLKYTAKVDIGWPGDSTGKLPKVLPAPAEPVRQAATVKHRFALNDTDDGYSGAYRDWAAFERQIDLLALNGANEVFVQMGADAVQYETFKEFGYSGAELRAWIPGPAHQPWWLLQNMSGFGGPVSERLLDERAALGRRIADRLRELGMTPVLPGYFGTVPPDFEAKNPGGRTVPQGDWVGFRRPDWLDPRTELFPKVAKAYYRHQSELFGDSSMYKMDLLHEGGKPGDVPVGEAARRVMDALQDAHPGATWTLLGWQNNPPAAIVDAVDKTKLFIVDGLSDRYADLDREKSWHGTPYAFGTIPNFGGHTTMGANTGVWVRRFEEWRKKPGSALQGIAYLPEGTGQSPVAFELFSELAWREAPVDHKEWFAQYAERRYGAADPHAARAWELLRTGPYDMPADNWSEPQDGLFTARPSLTVKSAASWSPTAMRYDAGKVRLALDELLQVAPAVRESDAYRFDLVDLARQALANHSRVLLPQIKSAYDAKDLDTFRQRSGEWRDDLRLLDRLLATDRRFLLGPWLADAREWGNSPQEKARYEFDARSLLTTWGHRSGSENGGLHDYANRELSGLVSDFYAKRWTTYLDTLDTALTSGQPPAAIDWFELENTWNKGRESYPVRPSGDPYTLAREVRATLPAPLPAGPVRSTDGACLDVTDGNGANGTALQLYVCNGTPAQTWAQPGDGTLRALGACMDARDGGTAPGTVVQIYGCNGTAAQDWTARSDRTIQNLKSKLCLASEGGTDGADGTDGTNRRIVLATCDPSSPAQQWRLPTA
ncbi:alpha-N-acetylglucosaminidase C-terminal domain-containing protein [Streptomyces sp. NA04227]|uniref:alpha-N-acetylglucosaminidase n=1 Tax=Streptomyces sp. NA04227 TaxID=2742136 RepID=UPI001591A293|nr:alpha-N-acetylglucosaminidase TIM-barrel domain-containing protein [Streptomyces sp. NA04227]QKW07542.1 alpha-N-acetylglucosaminidase C-terminal domain-containing protein [Streptomyces sp. NA04227]